jgi:hypothetical protein
MRPPLRAAADSEIVFGGSDEPNASRLDQAQQLIVSDPEQIEGVEVDIKRSYIPPHSHLFGLDGNRAQRIAQHAGVVRGLVVRAHARIDSKAGAIGDSVHRRVKPVGG